MGKVLHKRPSSDNDNDKGVAQLKTPRQVIPSLLDVSSGGRLHQLSRGEPATDERALPLS